MQLLILSIFAFFILLYLFRNLDEGKDSWATSLLCSFCLTVCGMAIWLIVIMPFFGITLTQLGLTLM